MLGAGSGRTGHPGRSYSAANFDVTKTSSWRRTTTHSPFWDVKTYLSSLDGWGCPKHRNLLDSHDLVASWVQCHQRQPAAWLPRYQQPTLFGSTLFKTAYKTWLHWLDAQVYLGGKDSVSRMGNHKWSATHPWVGIPTNKSAVFIFKAPKQNILMVGLLQHFSWTEQNPKPWQVLRRS